jgi:NAD(P)-dependent dehydrogenase (short-subunit alcohol dehydrogenase family)
MTLREGLAGRTAFVTGGARGIELAIAEALARRGANLTLPDVDIKYAEAAVLGCAAAPRPLHFAGSTQISGVNCVHPPES